MNPNLDLNPLRPMGVSGYVAFAGDRRAAYMQHKSGAMRRIVRNGADEVCFVNKLTKSQRKAQKRARHQHSTPA